MICIQLDEELDQPSNVRLQGLTIDPTVGPTVGQTVGSIVKPCKHHIKVKTKLMIETSHY